MKKLAFMLTLLLLCASLCTPAAAASKTASVPKETPSGASSETKSAGASSGTSSGGASGGSSGAASGASSGDPAQSGASSSGAGGSASNSGVGMPPPFVSELQSEAIYILNLDSGQAVWSQEEQKRMYPASLTKIMTCIIALESGRDLENEKTGLKAYIQNELYNKQVDTLGGIYMNEELTIHDLLYAMMLQSANEAAMMVADYIGDGNIDMFCELMNKKAKELGANNTNFCNATGLHDENNYTTAYDMALIAKYAMENPDFKEIVTTNTYTSGPTGRHPEGITWFTRNSMQKSSSTDYYYEGLEGVKTGSLPMEEVGGRGLHNFVSTATRNGYSYLIVLLGAPDRDEAGLKYSFNLSFFDAKKLYDWVFDSYTVKTLMEIGKEVAEVPVRLSWDTKHIKLLAADKFASLVLNETTSDSITAIPDIPKSIDAPIKRGQTVGYAKLMLNGLEVGRVKLVAGESVARSDALYYLDKVKTFFNTVVFKFIFTFVLIILILYIILMIIRNRNKRRYQMRRRRPPPR